ncbi:MAG: hypothetical protein U5L45_03100 [Saprospiraceae bacterium]|nr:hypothetical protein [Saprospiraceae bacterium]
MACKNAPKKEAQSVDNQNFNSRLTVKNSSDYSEAFVQNLAKMPSSEFKKIELQDSFLIINGSDTTQFPDVPRLGHSFKLTGRQGDIAITLIVNRLNYTTIDYNIEIVEFGKTSITHKGQADIVASFFLGGESDEDKEGNAYPVTEFHDTKDSCQTSIRLGYKEDSNSFLLGKLIKNCNGKIKNITLENFGTLIEK